MKAEVTLRVYVTNYVNKTVKIEPLGKTSE